MSRQLPLPPMRPMPPARNPPPPMPPARQKWRLEKIGYDRCHLFIDGTMTRVEVFRLIGELERLGGSL